jgi:hypothetical protein
MGGIMVLDEAWRRFEEEELCREHLSLDQKYRIIDALYEEAVFLEAFRSKDPLEGLDVDIRVARVLNHVPKAA